MINVQMDKVNPKFDLGETVFAILGPDNYCQGQVTAYRSWVTKDKDKILVIPTEARLSTFTLSDYFKDIEQDAVPFRYLTDDEEQAKNWSGVIPVDCSDEDWFKAIGKRPDIEKMIAKDKYSYDLEDSLEDSELGVCCANISAVRDMLIKCRDNKGLIGWEVERLQGLCRNSYHDFPEDAPTLTNILKQLNVKWS